MPITVGHVLTATTPDNTSYEIRPSHWNSSHAVTLSQNWQATGNTTQSTSGGGDGMFISGVGLASVGVSNNSIIVSVPPAGSHNSANHSGDIIPNAVQDFKNNAISLGTAAVPAASADRLVLYGFIEQGKHRLGMVTPSGQQITHAQDSNIIVRNTSGATIDPGKAVYVTGSTGQTPNVSPAKADALVTMPAIGITAESIPNNGFGRVMIAGVADQLDTSAFTEGDRLWVSAATAGALTATEPGYPNLRQRIAIVINAHATQGKLLVLNTGARGEFGIQAVTAGTTFVTNNGISFANSNGLSFGLNNSTVTGTYTVPTVPAQLSVGNSNLGNTAGDTGVFTGRVVLVGSNNITLSASSNGGSQTISIIGGGGGAAFSGGLSGGNTSGDTGTVSNRIVFAGGNNITVSGSTNAGGMSVTISGANAGGAQTGISGVVVSDTTYTSGTISFSNQNGVTIGSSVNGATQYVRLSVANQSNQTGAVYVTAQSTGQSSSSTYDARSLSIVPDGIISAGWSNGSFRISATQSNQAWSGSNASSAFQTLVFNNANGVSWSNNAGSVEASYSRPVVSNAIQSVGSATGSGTNTSRFAADDHVHAGVFSVGVSTAGNTVGDTRVDVGRFVFQGGNNVTLSQITAANALNTIVISGANAGGAQTAISGIGASNTTYTSGTVIWSGQANVTVGSSVDGASQYVRLSAYAPVVSNAIQSVGSATGSGTNTSRFAADDHVHAGVFSMGVSNVGNTAGDTRVDVGRFVFAGGNNVTLSQGTAANALNTITISAANQTNQTLGLYAVSNTTGQSSSSTFDARTVSFHGAGIASVGYSGGSVIISVPAGGGGLTNINVSAGTTSQNLSNIVFSNSNGVSFGLNGSTITGSVNAAGGGITLTQFNPFGLNPGDFVAWAQTTLHFCPMVVHDEIRLDRIVTPLRYSQATNSTLTVTVAYHHCLFTKNGSTLSSIHSTSNTFTVNGSGTASSGQNSGIRLWTWPWTTTIPASEYYVGQFFSSATAGANATLSQVRLSTVASVVSGLMGVASTISIQRFLGLGEYSVGTGAMPGTVGFTELRGGATREQRPYLFHYLSGTV